MSSDRLSFRQAAILSTLVSEDQLRDTVLQLRSELESGSSTTVKVKDKTLAARLVETNILTPYQADQLLAGRTKLTLGPYIVTDWIGQGGMGQVFKAIHKMLGRESAVKVLPLNKATPEAISNFRREIQTQATLDHPNLVRAFDAGEDGNVHYLVVEYVPGTDLRRLVRTQGRLTVQQAANIIKQSAEGLAHAHEQNLIHRDIKPGNILVTPEGVAKVSDLGLAGYLNDANDPRSGKIVGTADYLSPEQIITNGRVTKASDIYSLGCTLYYGVSGKVPYPGGTPKSKARRHLEETPWHPRRFNEEVSDEFVDLIGDMMEKDPTQRIQSAEEVADRLAPWASDESPLLGTPLHRTRWHAPPVPDKDEDTDTGDDIAEMAMTELSGMSETSHGSMSGTELSGIKQSDSSGSAPPLVSVTEQFSSARRITTDDPTFSLNWLMITGLICAALGGVAGFIIGKLL